jgi:hypothetical protein
MEDPINPDNSDPINDREYSDWVYRLEEILRRLLVYRNFHLQVDNPVEPAMQGLLDLALSIQSLVREQLFSISSRGNDDINFSPSEVDSLGNPKQIRISFPKLEIADWRLSFLLDQIVELSSLALYIAKEIPPQIKEVIARQWKMESVENPRDFSPLSYKDPDWPSLYREMGFQSRAFAKNCAWNEQRICDCPDCLKGQKPLPEKDPHTDYDQYWRKIRNRKEQTRKGGRSCVPFDDLRSRKLHSPPHDQSDGCADGESTPTHNRRLSKHG